MLGSSEADARRRELSCRPVDFLGGHRQSRAGFVEITAGFRQLLPDAIALVGQVVSSREGCEQGKTENGDDNPRQQRHQPRVRHRCRATRSDRAHITGRRLSRSPATPAAPSEAHRLAVVRNVLADVGKVRKHSFPQSPVRLYDGSLFAPRPEVPDRDWTSSRRARPALPFVISSGIVCRAEERVTSIAEPTGEIAPNLHEVSIETLENPVTRDN